MRIAIVMDPISGLHTYKDSTYAIMREAATRGHELFALRQQDIAYVEGDVVGHAKSLTLNAEVTPWYALGRAATSALQSFDVVLMRKDPPFDSEYIYSTYLLELAETRGARVVNRPRALRDFNEKLATAKFPQFMPPTLVTRDSARIRDFLTIHNDTIFKPLDGMGGRGIFRVRLNDYNLSVIIETLTEFGQRSVMVQRYIPEIVKGDKRILLINGDPLPYALARIPASGETRGNLAAGGKGVAQPLSDRDREIAEAVGPALRGAGLFLVGLDVIGDYLTEINVTSPTGMQEITAQTGYNVAGAVLDALEALW